MNTELSKELVYKLSMESYGITPGVIKEMAARSVPLAYMYLIGTQTMERSSLTDLEINAIELKISALNKCESCMKGHTYLVKKAGLEDNDVNAIVHNEDTSIDRLNILLKAAEYIYYSGSGTYPDLAMDFFEDNELSEQVLFEIIGLISLKTISNYVNNYLATKKLKIA
ncbi:MAG TPA: carboxymuconolactone decarboxylase family protein [Cyclobacteriaceae bacterium]|nr:carboxymuconolactone decarboxylase family protein [Cyclobacteriaceae bacterium]